ncbi:MAG: hypothetical protein ACOC8N_07995 [Spirochaetota bacterium]
MAVELCSRGFQGDIFATAATRDLARLILQDSAHIQARDQAFLEKRGRPAVPPLYTGEEAAAALGQFVSVSYRHPFQPAAGTRAVFLDAGHILGFCQVTLEVPSGGGSLRLGFSGDLGRKNLPILRDPEPMPPVGESPGSRCTWTAPWR